jgi:4-amino-4-deoxy-L-arabinose transferase-like glycosyltransferase
MMVGYGSSVGGSALMHFFSGLLGLAFLIGLVFFLAWAIKTLKKDQLLHWAILLVAVAAIGWILIASFGKYMTGNNFSKNGALNRGGPGMMWGSYNSNGR